MNVVPVAHARRLLLHGLALTADPNQRSSPRRIQAIVHQLGFVQVDTITVVERAHHLIVRSRLHDYQPKHLTRLLEQDRSLFEHWTHDASIIPTAFYPYWKHRFEARRSKERLSTWWQERFGDGRDQIVRHVLARVEREGPLLTRDFERPRDRSAPAGQGWWSWSPEKAALEHLWRCGQLMITRRDGFQKVYDIPERVLDAQVLDCSCARAELIDWACTSALERLGCATAAELAAFWRAVPLAEVRDWIRSAVARGQAEPVRIESVDGRAVAGVARPDWKRWGARVELPSGVRLLCPFDPLVRDRARIQRLFGFDYRFEGFVPRAQRRHGYYVMAMLEGDRLIGRLDPKLDRAAGVLRVRGLSLESGVRMTATRRKAVHRAIDSFATWLGAESVELTETK